MPVFASDSQSDPKIDCYNLNFYTFTIYFCLSLNNCHHAYNIHYHVSTNHFKILFSGSNSLLLTFNYLYGIFPGVSQATHCLLFSLIVLDGAILTQDRWDRNLMQHFFPHYCLYINVCILYIVPTFYLSLKSLYLLLLLLPHLETLKLLPLSVSILDSFQSIFYIQTKEIFLKSIYKYGISLFKML